MTDEQERGIRDEARRALRDYNVDCGHFPQPKTTICTTCMFDLLVRDKYALEQARADLASEKRFSDELRACVADANGHLDCTRHRLEQARAELAQQQKDHHLDLAKAMGERDAYAKRFHELELLLKNTCEELEDVVEAVAAEREACARIADEWGVFPHPEIGRAIRARGDRQ